LDETKKKKEEQKKEEQKKEEKKDEEKDREEEDEKKEEKNSKASTVSFFLRTDVENAPSQKGGKFECIRGVNPSRLSPCIVRIRVVLAIPILHDESFQKDTRDPIVCVCSWYAGHLRAPALFSSRRLSR